VAVAASSSVFSYYKSGILNDAAGCGTSINHAVDLVGYDDKSYLIRNSWGTSWGNKGYI